MKKILLTVVSGSALVLLIAGVAGFYWFNSQLEAVSSSQESVLFTVESGASLKQVATELESAGLIKSATVFEVKQKIDRDTVVKVGTYELSPSQTSEAIATQLIEGKVATESYIVKSGITVEELKLSLVEQGLEEADVDNALQQSYGSRVENLASWDDLEGLILADTYQIDFGQGADQVIKQALAASDTAVLEYESDFAKQNLSAEGALILASIIQEEVAGYDDMQRVAGVFLQRLDIGISLGSDPTFKYAATKLGVAEAVDIDSPYNTRIYAGLPPGPISTFDVEALAAIADPVKTDDLFFVAGDDGVTHFSETLAEHEANALKYCTVLCQ